VGRRSPIPNKDIKDSKDIKDEKSCILRVLEVFDVLGVLLRATAAVMIIAPVC
jgi:hypothetical protein